MESEGKAPDTVSAHADERLGLRAQPSAQPGVLTYS
jgi:hypothetical protein